MLKLYFKKLSKKIRLENNLAYNKTEFRINDCKFSITNKIYINLIDNINNINFMKNQFIIWFENKSVNKIN